MLLTDYYGNGNRRWIPKIFLPVGSETWTKENSAKTVRHLEDDFRSSGGAKVFFEFIDSDKEICEINEKLQSTIALIRESIEQSVTRLQRDCEETVQRLEEKAAKEIEKIKKKKNGGE
jgi:hypothetical protein